MKKIVLTILMLLSALAAAQAQAGAWGIDINKPTVDKVGDLVKVAFRATVGQKVVRSGYSTIFAPVITDGTWSWSMPSIIVEGSRAARTRNRGTIAPGNEAFYQDAYFTRNGGTVEYTAVIPYQEWMDGARLEMEGITIGCCSSSMLSSQVMAGELGLQPSGETSQTVEPVRETVTIAELLPLSTGDKLAESYSFIVPSDKYEEIISGQLYDDDRENTLTIFFANGRHDIMRDYGTNRQSLVDLMSSIRIIENSRDSRVKAIVIAGFASPEGGHELNDRLAWNRAVSVKEYILNNSGLSDGMVKIYNGSSDWQGLRMLVEKSDMPEKYRILDIIDNTPVWDSRRGVGRLGQLMLLDGGEPYRYMYKHFFPELRNAAYIRVYYENY